mgnify:CR=1 FL=1
MSQPEALRHRRARAFVIAAVLALFGCSFAAVASSASSRAAKTASPPVEKTAVEDGSSAVDASAASAPAGGSDASESAAAEGEAIVDDDAAAATSTSVPSSSTTTSAPSTTQSPPRPATGAPSAAPALQLPEVTPPPVPAGPVYDVPTSIDPTGSVDVTAELLAFIASVPDGSIIRFPAGATYRAEGSLRIENRNNLVFEGNGATVIADSTADRNRRHWWFVGGSNITIRDLGVRGANPNAGTSEAAYVASLEAQHGFEFAGVIGVLLERARVTDVYGDFVYLGPGAGRWSQNVVIRDSHFERNGRQGVAVTGARDVLITGNFISHTRRATFDLEPNGSGWGASNIQIVGNQIGPGRLLFVAAVGSPSGLVSDVLVKDNTLSGRAMNITVGGAPLPAELRRSNFVVVGNRSDTGWGNPGGSLMSFSGIDGVVVSGNVQPLQRGRGNAGVGVTYSCDVRVEGNTFTNAIEELRQDDWSCDPNAEWRTLTREELIRRAAEQGIELHI